MISEYVATATLCHELIDCRMLQLEFEFYQLTRSQTVQLAWLTYLELKRLLSERFYVEWKWNNRRITEDSLCSVLDKKTGCFSFCGDVISEVVYDAKSFKNYDKRLRFDISTPWEAQCIPTDYYEVFYRHFANITSAEACKNAVLSFFNQESRAKVALWRKHDLSGTFDIQEYSNNADMMHGTFNFRISATCLDSNALMFSNQLKEIACNASQLVGNLSGRVTLSPIDKPSPCSGHMAYFSGRLAESDEQKKSGFCSVEWNPYYYLRGAEWFNIVSPLQHIHLPHLKRRDLMESNVSIQPLPNGGTIVCSLKDILSTDVSELLSIKKVLYSALYPGSSEILFKHLFNPKEFGFMAKPRHEWEYVPLFESEIHVLLDRVVFRHGNYKSGAYDTSS